VALEEPQTAVVLPNGKRLTSIVMERTMRTFLRMFTESQTVHQLWKREFLLRFRDFAGAPGPVC
jgi:hypothetical protein